MIFKRLEPLIDSLALTKLASARVAVVGLGGVGGIACEALARSGIENLVICDFDIIEQSNINRQIVASTKTLNRKKTSIMAQIIYDINPNCKVTIIDKPYYNFLNDLEIEYVIDAIDEVKSKIALIEDCLSNNINFVSSMGAGNKTNISLIKISKLSKTSYDPLAKILRAKFKDVDFSVVYSNEVNKMASKTRPVASYMPVVATFGLYCADYIIKEILRINL